MAILADSINNNGIYAVRAEADKDGNRIDTVYAKKTDLSVYATTSAMETALAGKENTISDLDTIRAGAALGATAAQPSDLPSSDELVPSATSGDSGKVLTVNAQGAAEWANSPVNVDTTNKIIQFGPNLQASYYDGGSQSVPFDLNMSQNGDYVVMEFSLPQHQNFNPNGVVFTIDSDFTVGSLYTDGQAYDCYKILADSTPATDGSGFMFADPATGPTSGKACRGTYTISSGATLVNVLTLKIRFNSSDDAASGYTRILNNWSSHVQVQSTYSTYSAQFVPAFTSADSGKVLQVQNDGTLAWVTLS